MTVFQHVTGSPEALAELLASVLTTDGPWDKAWEKVHCDGCQREECGGCPHEADDRTRIAWWLGQEKKTDKEEIKELMKQICDSYCKYPERDGWKAMQELDSICEACPLNKLLDLIGA